MFMLMTMLILMTAIFVLVVYRICHTLVRFSFTLQKYGKCFATRLQICNPVLLLEQRSNPEHQNSANGTSTNLANQATPIDT